MPATLVSSSDTEVTVPFTVRLGRSMLDNEVALQCALNEAGTLATQKVLEAFDADGAPLQVGGRRMTSRGRIAKTYQTPYGEVTVARHLYQPAGGGRTYCPLDHDARIVVASTPHFARTLSCKYAEMSGVRRVLFDLEQNHSRRLSLGVVQDVADAVATVARSDGGNTRAVRPRRSAEAYHVRRGEPRAWQSQFFCGVRAGNQPRPRCVPDRHARGTGRWGGKQLDVSHRAYRRANARFLSRE